MSIETYRQIVNERLAAIEKARKSVQRASNLISSTFLWRALEQLKLARLEVEADLRAHERVAAEKTAEQGVQLTGLTPCPKCGLIKNHAVSCPELIFDTPRN